MELAEKIKILGEQHAFGVNKLTKIGNSYAIILPKVWVQMHCVDIDGGYYLRLEVEDNQLIFSPIELEDVEAIVIKEKVKEKRDDRR
jgi:antitoxin component of MazEF toxin-antitoxin module